MQKVISSAPCVSSTSRRRLYYVQSSISLKSNAVNVSSHRVACVPKWDCALMIRCKAPKVNIVFINNKTEIDRRGDRFVRSLHSPWFSMAARQDRVVDETFFFFRDGLEKENSVAPYRTSASSVVLRVHLHLSPFPRVGCYRLESRESL